MKKRLRNSSIYDTQQTPFGNNKAEEITENIDPDTTPVIYSDAQNNIQTPIDLRNPKAYRNQVNFSLFKNIRPLNQYLYQEITLRVTGKRTMLIM
mgnify:CR=1 FL=1